ncbi:hypothetical protein KXX15_001530 [Aspergillus fumigatus]|nr:hypothetical protein KXX15_001530 [Aspergillus fumigatus]KAH1711046.1 hypothetical protein KXX23_008611 [Aspergillus fumigatus]KAH1938030.1 hypothetical protein KXV48_006646 [Aspergillus fumigatus]KAH2011793.1 hypothetical protein KXV45_007089 [Aspergillus fumigatus]KAH2468166.1 hypothetical protein KXW63_000863 [Aspergillus fumigatus]
MIVTGVYVYLPDHLRSIYGHLYYYWAGERPFVSTGLPSIGAVFRDNSTKTLEMVYDTVKDAAATATGPIAELSIHIHFSVRSSLVLLDETSMSQLPILSILVIGLLHTKAL